MPASLGDRSLRSRQGPDDMAVPRHDDVKPWKRWIPVSSCRWRLICWFQVQGMDEPELWRPRGTEVPASRQEAELARSPLHTVAACLPGGTCSCLWDGTCVLPWGGTSWWSSEEVQGYLYGWRIFAALQKHSIVPIPETAPVAPDPDPWH